MALPTRLLSGRPSVRSNGSAEQWRQGKGGALSGRGGAAAGAAVLFAVLLGALVVSVYVLTGVIQIQQAALGFPHLEMHEAPERLRTLRFGVCPGTAEQRLSILYGSLIALELGRALVLPNLPPLEPGAPDVPFGDVYDEERFIQGLARLGLDALKAADLRAAGSGLPSPLVDVSTLDEPLQHLHTRHREALDLHISCPLFSLKASELRGSNMPVVSGVLSALHPSPPRARLVRQVASHLRSLSGSREFVVLQLNIDQEWLARCAREAVPTAAAATAAACAGEVHNLDTTLRSFNVPTNVPLFVAAHWGDVDPVKAQTVLSQLGKAGYQVVTSREVPHGFTNTPSSSDDALVLELSLQAARYLGNPFDHRAALVVMQRRQAGRWAGFYTPGPVALEAHIPSRMLPWVFAYTSSTPDNDYMVQAAVLSAAGQPGVQPYCLWSGNTSSPLYAWLSNNGVTLVEHSLGWAQELWALAAPHLGANTQGARMFGSRLLLTSEFSGADLPLVPELEQYTYVLLTSPYAVFLRETSLLTLAPQLPRVITAHTANADGSPAIVSSVLLLNLPELRSSYEEFKVFVLSSRHGGLFPGYGPGAGGALTQFYEPYATQLPAAADGHGAARHAPLAAATSGDYGVRPHVLVFDGPVVHEFLEYYRTGKCTLGWACHTGLRKSLCPYVREWAAVLDQEQEPVGVAMAYACDTVYSPQLEWPKFRLDGQAKLPGLQGLLEEARQAFVSAESVAKRIVA